MEYNSEAVYETHIEDILNVIRERLEELTGKDLDDFETGKKLAYTELLEIVSSRYKMILETLA